MIRRILPLAVLVLASACAKPAEPRVEVADALCRPTIANRPVTGCYMTLTASVPDRLLAVASPSSSKVALHSMTMDGGIMRMAPMPRGLALPAGQKTALKPGGDHVMLEALSGPLAVGDEVELRLTFEKAPPVTVRARVANPAPDAHGGH